MLKISRPEESEPVHHPGHDALRVVGECEGGNGPVGCLGEAVVRFHPASCELPA